MPDLVSRAEQIKQRHVSKYKSASSTMHRVLEMYAQVPAPVYVLPQNADIASKKRHTV